MAINRVLDPEPVRTLGDHRDGGGGDGLDVARQLEPDEIIALVSASGLRGRGGAGFPTGTKWATVARYRGAGQVIPVVVNAAEGEPGSFKDRALIRRNPYKVIEGALIASRAVGAEQVVAALKASFTVEAGLLRDAWAEMHQAGWTDGLDFRLVEGPSEYLYGEETALLEVLDGRPPLPRVVPPFREGVNVDLPGDGDTGDGDTSDPEIVSPPVLVNNVETLANVGGVIANGPDWFRSQGTQDSPGTIVCTVSGATQRAGVAEYPMGTRLDEVIADVGGGPEPDHHIVCVLSGVANPIIPADRLDTPLSHEAMKAAGTGLGATGFIVFDDRTDPVAVAQGTARFLAVESCGQCTPCKQDGLALAELLDRLRTSTIDEAQLAEIGERTRTVTDGARCYLAHQQQRVVASLLELFGGSVTAHANRSTGPVEPVVIAPLTGIDDGAATLDEAEATKQPDWRFDDHPWSGPWSGQSPADRLTDART